MRTFVLKNKKIQTVSMDRFDSGAKSRAFSIEVDGITVDFDKKSREATMALESRMGPKDIESYFEGANFSFLRGETGEEFLDYGLKGSYILPDHLIEAYEEAIGVTPKNASMTSIVQKMPGMHTNAFLGGHEAEIEVSYASKGEGGLSQIKSLFTWSHHSKLLSMHAAEVRLLCTNGMAATKAVEGNSVMILNDFERNLEISEQGFLSKVANSMDEKYSRLVHKSLTIRQAVNLAETLKNVALMLRSNHFADDAVRLEAVSFMVYKVLLETNTLNGIKDPAFGGAPTRVPAVQAVDILTETLTHYLTKLPEMGGYGNFSNVQKLIQELMFNEQGVFVMPALEESVKWDPDRPFYTK